MCVGGGVRGAVGTLARTVGERRGAHLHHEQPGAEDVEAAAGADDEAARVAVGLLPQVGLRGAKLGVEDLGGQ